MGPQIINTGVYGPLPKGTAGIILGRSSITLKGLTILPGLIDEDYEGEIKIMVQSQKSPIMIEAGTRLAQILLVPYIPEGQVLQHQKRGTNAFGSSDAIFWVQQVKKEWPQLELKINGKIFTGLINAGADVSVISWMHWPQQWPTHFTVTHLQGIGQSHSPQQSAQLLHWQDSEGNNGMFKPYVLPHLPINLWGRDVLEKMGVLLISSNSAVNHMLLNQGFDPRLGLGKNQQGIRNPLAAIPKSSRKGLGFS